MVMKIVWQKQEYQSVSLKQGTYWNAGLIYTCRRWSGSCRFLSLMSGLQTPTLFAWDTRVRLAPLSAAGPSKLSWLALLHSGVSLVVSTALPTNPPLPDKYHYITWTSADQQQRIAHGRHISPPFTITWPAQHSLCTAQEADFQRTVLHMMTGGNSC